jgi:hypothetical protein
VSRLACVILMMSACSELGVSVQVFAASDVPPLDVLRVEVTQSGLDVSQSFSLAGRPLPQSVAVVSKGLTHGTVNVAVVGLARGTTLASGSASTDLRFASVNPTVSIVLERACDGGDCPCLPATCPSGGCGTLDDGCGGTLDCGGCSAGQSCLDNVCLVECQPRTCAGAAAQCGLVSDGCGGQIDCGRCDAGACGGAGVPNQCACRTVCPPRACTDWPDGCGSTLACGTTTCPPPSTCITAGAGSGGSCGCDVPLTDCDGTCVDLSSDPANCGKCGNACPSPGTCRAGKCSCDSLASNADGHCCPPGWTFDTTVSGSQPRCFLGPFDAGTTTDAIAQCRKATLDSFGRAVSAVGAGAAPVTNANNALPSGACGTFLFEPTGGVVFTSSPHNITVSACNAGCAQACTCTGCTCVQPMGSTGFGCVQPYYCVMDPLGPRYSGACAGSGGCAAGDFCDGGNCVSAGVPFCVVDADCGTGSTCVYRGLGETGLCR